jgi:uncharacterized protein
MWVGIVCSLSEISDQQLERALARSPVVLLTGARQTGKTTLIKEIGQDASYTYVTFDDLRFLSAAKHDPIGFIAGLQKPVILDEVQRVPEIFLAIKHDVDEHRVAGRYALTGSASPLLIPRLGDSLAGRMEIFELFPLSQGELLGRVEVFIDRAFNGQVPLVSPEPISKKNLKKSLYEKVIMGGYPLVQNLDQEGRDSWFNSYITTILQRDVRELAHIAGLSELPHLLRILATRVGQLLNVAELARTSGIASSTLHRYLTLLETIFIIYFQPPWSANLGKRLVKAPKTYLVDTGLVSFLLGIDLERALGDGKLMGSVLENFVLAELYKQATWSTTRVKTYYFRTVTGIEVDIVLEDQAGHSIGIEVKSSDTVSSSDFKGLRYLEEAIGKNFIRGILLYTGSEYVPFSPTLCAVPITSLWEL